MLKLSRLNSSRRAPRSRRSAAALAGLVAATGLVLTACSGSTTDAPRTVTKTAPPPSSTSASSSSAPTSTAPAVPKKVVKITTLNSDGAEYGVGMPVIVYFSKKITSAKDWQAKTSASVNGKPIKVAWYFEYSSYGNGPIEAHLRPQNYWPAHARIHISFPPRGTSLGGDYVSDGKLSSLDFTTGAAHIGVVNDATHQLTITSDGKLYGKFPVSLGASNTPTARGTKVIMEKGRSICMHGPGYSECGVKFTQRLTYGGEYLHSAPWNCTGSPGCSGPANNIGSADSSNGCTNLTPTDAEKLYHYLRVGDVVQYPNANGPAMSLGAGYGDWNVDWTTWQTGGLVSTIT